MKKEKEAFCRFQVREGALGRTGAPPPRFDSGGGIQKPYTIYLLQL